MMKTNNYSTLKRIIMTLLLLALSMLLFACGSGDSAQDSDGETDVVEADTSDDIETDEGEASGIDLPNIVANPDIVDVDKRYIFDHFKKIEAEWKSDLFMYDEWLNYKMTYEWLGEGEVNGEAVDHIKIVIEEETEDISLDVEYSFTKSDYRYAENAEVISFTHPNDDFEGANFGLQTILPAIEHLFELFNTHRIMLTEDMVVLLDHQEEAGSVAGHDVALHTLVIGDALQFGGGYYSNREIELAVFDEFEILLNIDTDSGNIYDVNITTLEFH